MAVDLMKIAEVLEHAASLIDAREAEKVAAVRSAREESIQALASKYAEATGEELDGDALEKLANSDQALFTTIQRMVEKSGSAGVEPLGRVSEKRAGDQQPTNKREAAQQAWERFGNFINN